MFVRQKRVGGYAYLRLVENRREEGKTRQRVVATPGRADVLQAKGGVDALLRSLGLPRPPSKRQIPHAKDVPNNGLSD